MNRVSRGVAAAALTVLVIVPGALAQASPSIKITSPSDGAKVTTTDIPVTVAISNFTVDCLQAGRPDAQGIGHWHFMVDGNTMMQLTNFYCSDNVTISGEGIAAGQHTLTAVLASNTHEDLGQPMSVKIDYQPATPKPAPAPAPGGTPTVKIVSPSDGASVDPKFTVQVASTDFHPSLELEGRPNISGYGHYHVFVDLNMASMQGGQEMMSMGGMVAMPGSDTIPLDLSAWGPGKHTITVELVKNDHTPIENAKAAMISVDVQGGPNQLPNTGGDPGIGQQTLLALAAAATFLVVGGALRLAAARRR